MFTKWVLLSRALVCNFGGFVSFLAGLFGFILAGTDIRRNSYGQFWSTKIQSDQMDNFVPQTDTQTDTQTDRHTDRHTDTLLIFISIEKQTVQDFIGVDRRKNLILLCRQTFDEVKMSRQSRKK